MGFFSLRLPNCYIKNLTKFSCYIVHSLSKPSRTTCWYIPHTHQPLHATCNPPHQYNPRTLHKFKQPSYTTYHIILTLHTHPSHTCTVYNPHTLHIQPSCTTQQHKPHSSSKEKPREDKPSSPTRSASAQERYTDIIRTGL